MFSSVRQVSTGKLPWAQWLILILIALGGSGLYGYSVARNIGEEALSGAIWLTLCAGLGWAALIPSLVVFGRVLWHVAFHACLLTMAVGECILTVGALINFGFPDSGVAANLGIVAVSNLAMASTLVRLLVQVGVSWGTTLLLWMLVLNGVGGLAFLLIPMGGLI